METSDSHDKAMWRAMLARFQTPGSPAAKPLATFLAGQMGSGKTSAASAIAARLPEGEAHVVIDGDAIAQMNPRYAAIEAALGTQQAQKETLAFASKWQSALLAHASDTGAHVTIEVAPARVDLRTLAFEREVSGYATNLAILAVPEHESRQAIARRFANEVAERGAGRAVSQRDHDATYAEWPAALARIHEGQSFGRIEVISNRRAANGPDPQVIGTWTRNPDGSYEGPPEGPLATLIGERTRPVAAADRFMHARRWADLAKLGAANAIDMQKVDANRLSAPRDARVRREIALAANADAALNGTAGPSAQTAMALRAAQARLLPQSAGVSAPAPLKAPAR